MLLSDQSLETMETAEEGRSLSEVRADPGGESDEDDEFRPGAGVTKREITAEVLAPADPAASGLHGEMNGGPVADSKAREPSAEVQGAPVVPVPTGSFRDVRTTAPVTCAHDNRVCVWCIALLSGNRC